MDIATALDFIKDHRDGVLTTLKRDGRPQLSTIWYAAFADGTIRISATADRAKTVNLRRDPRASLWVNGGDFGRYVVVDAGATVTPTAEEPGDATVAALIDLYRAIRGEDHPDWDEYRAAMVDQRRVVLVLNPTHAYGALPNP